MEHPLLSNVHATTEFRPSTKLLSPAELRALDAQCSANADKWLKHNAPKAKSSAERKLKSNCGRKPNIVENPFYGFIGCTTYGGRYPRFAMDIIEGVARLDWHDRPDGRVGKSMPLSVRNLAVILEGLPAITNEAVEDLLHLEERHARRYFKAMQLIVPAMMKNRPQSLINEMDGSVPPQKNCEWKDSDVARTPSATELEKLHYDLRTMTEYGTEEEYDADYPDMSAGFSSVAPKPVELPTRTNPKKADVLRLLASGMKVAAIQREIGVSRVTINKWRAEQQQIAA